MEMPGFENLCKRKASWNLISRSLVSFVSLFLTQFALYMVPYYFPTSSLLTLLSISALVLLAVAGFGRCSKKLLGVRASAPAFVFFSILFIWSVYFVVIRQTISPLLDILFNTELVMLLIGLYSMLSSDPGFVTHKSSCLEKFVKSSLSEVEAHAEELELLNCGMQQEFPTEESSDSGQRVRYCRHCNAYVKGFDHHCPAFGNCIGQKNHALFIILLAGFVMSEASYIICSFQCKLGFDYLLPYDIILHPLCCFIHGKRLSGVWKGSPVRLCWISVVTKSERLEEDGREPSLLGNLALSTMLFSLLQVVWQMVYLAWHIYCVSLNIRTDEWINWKRYPEFQLIVHPQPGQPLNETRFTNPYDKGILRNLKEFLIEKG